MRLVKFLSFQVDIFKVKNISFRARKEQQATVFLDSNQIKSKIMFVFKTQLHSCYGALSPYH